MRTECTAGTVAGCLVAGLLFAGCVLVDPGGLGNHLELFYRLEEPVQKGKTAEMASWVLDGRLRLQNGFVRLSGSLQLPPGDSRPRRLVVTAEAVDPDTGALDDRLRVKLDVRTEGTFRRVKRMGQRVRSGSLVTVTVKPKGAPLPVGTEVRFCFDIARARSDLDTTPSCASAGQATTFDAIQQSFFTPTCARGGCHDAATASADLVLEEGAAFANLVGVPSSQVFRFDRVDPGDPEASYLIKKLRGTSDIMGVRMPVGGPFLSPGQIAGIYEWIETGATAN